MRWPVPQLKIRPRFRYVGNYPATLFHHLGFQAACLTQTPPLRLAPAPPEPQAAYKTLSAWETRPRFFTSVQQVFSNKSVDVNVCACRCDRLVLTCHGACLPCNPAYAIPRSGMWQLYSSRTASIATGGNAPPSMEMSHCTILVSKMHPPIVVPDLRVAVWPPAAVGSARRRKQP
jgi:hypothetical protein